MRERGREGWVERERENVCVSERERGRERDGPSKRGSKWSAGMPNPSESDFNTFSVNPVQKQFSCTFVPGFCAE